MKKALIKKTDYDFYTISLPLSVLRKKRRKAFVSGELEKRHPQFSAALATDTRYTLRHFHPAAEITVMDGSVLADYHRRFPGQRLLLEGKKDYPVFFSPLNRKRSVIALFIFTGAFMGLFAPFLLKKDSPFWIGLLKRPAESSAPQQKSEKEYVEKESPPLNLVDSSKLAQFICEGFFSNVASSQAQLSSFSWEQGSLSASVSGCNPEAILSTLVSSVSYEKNKPHFSVKMPAPRTLGMAGKKIPDEKEESFLAREFIPLIRRELLSNKCQIQREEMNQGKVTVAFHCESSRLSKVLWACSNLCALAYLRGFSLWESAINLNPGSGERNPVSVSLSWELCPETISSTERESSVFLACSKYPSIFVFQPARILKSPQPEKAPAPTNQSLQKIGEIVQGTTRFVYFKSDLNGQITIEKKEVVNE